GTSDGEHGIVDSGSRGRMGSVELARATRMLRQAGEQQVQSKSLGVRLFAYGSVFRTRAVKCFEETAPTQSESAEDMRQQGEEHRAKTSTPPKRGRRAVQTLEQCSSRTHDAFAPDSPVSLRDIFPPRLHGFRWQRCSGRPRVLATTVRKC